MTVDERIQILKNAAPDICVAIHHNRNGDYPSISGFECYYYSPFSMLAAKQIYENTKETDVYSRNMLYWHNYYVARQTCCPVVLTENGYLSNQSDLNNTLNAEAIAKKAQAIAQGVADYFLLLGQ
jgi:N-acetylmuramoyl-L-alanine amidase